ncbi:uncharacterized protein AKAW2_30976A [Aspergillus luchuensis]|uniref:Uncharacterized protein n=1 Tax=Aspergillus kawachii TaxID=1069201 RepID=A0A7R7W787_ASPKA|nr:uncharacterized protein AKAW2_30976A [Aspergillus luchuensis]BCR97657.1 hypothetical protein AKAW2_30976A [Aspergillus luchuensis]
MQQDCLLCLQVWILKGGCHLLTTVKDTTNLLPRSHPHRNLQALLPAPVFSAQIAFSLKEGRILPAYALLSPPPFFPSSFSPVPLAPSPLGLDLATSLSKS